MNRYEAAGANMTRFAAPIATRAVAIFLGAIATTVYEHERDADSAQCDATSASAAAAGSPGVNRLNPVAVAVLVGETALSCHTRLHGRLSFKPSSLTSSAHKEQHSIARSVVERSTSPRTASHSSQACRR